MILFTFRSTDPLKETIGNANAMIKKGQNAASLHAAYIKAMADEQGLNFDHYLNESD